MNGILRNIGWLLGSRGVNALFSLVYLALATRHLGLEDFGRFSLIVVLAQAVAGLASFHTWQAVIRWGAQDRMAGKAAGFALALDLASILGGGLIAVVVCWSASFWLPLPQELRWQAFVLCFACLLAIRSTPTGILRLHDRYDLAAMAEASLPATRAAGAVLAALFAPDIMGFLLTWAMAELVCAACYWRLAWKMEPVRWADISLRALPMSQDKVWRFVFATNLSRSLAVISRQVVLLLVGMLGGAAIAGGYRVASQLGQALVQLAEAVSRAVYPEFVRIGRHAHGVASRMSWLALFTGVLVVVLSVVGGEWALGTLAGPDFRVAHGAMIILSLAGAIELLGASWEALLVARGRAELAFALRLMPLAGGLALLPAAIGHTGMAGAAFCLLLASSLTAAGLAAAARKERGLHQI